jgi:hypothetical protein
MTTTAPSGELDDELGQMLDTLESIRANGGGDAEVAAQIDFISAWLRFIARSEPDPVHAARIRGAARHCADAAAALRKER